MKGVAGVIILYRPELPKVLANIQSYISLTDRLYIIDNTGNSAAHIDWPFSSGQTTYLPNQQNEGIGKALNKAARLALSEGYQWLLTMDQDSRFEETELNSYIVQFERLFWNDPNVAVVGPSIEPVARDADKSVFVKVNKVITSGSLIQLSLWEKLGGYDEKLFIDEVDHEYCYRAVSKGYQVICFKNIILDHKLGSKKNAGYFKTFAHRARTIHSPARVYFMVRNYLYVRKKYRKILPEEFDTRNRELMVTLKNNLFFSGKFFKNLASIRRGYIDFKRDNFTATI